MSTMLQYFHDFPEVFQAAFLAGFIIGVSVTLFSFAVGCLFNRKARNE